MGKKSSNVMIYRLTRFVIRLMFWLIARIRVYGMENIDLNQSCVAVGNHIGRLDPGLIYLVLNRRDIIMFVAEKYRKHAFYRWLIRAMDAIWVDRFNADMGAMRQALRRLKRGGVMVIAPEGTRSPTGALQRGHAGASFLAVKAGVPIVPVAIMGTEDHVVMDRLRRLRRLDIEARVGKPFMLPALHADDRESQLQEYTDEIMCHIAALLPAERRGFYADHPRLLELLTTEYTSTSATVQEIQPLRASQ
jgi:1-acyl-sn-glycerol-3-phosphate acyltransferase